MIENPHTKNYRGASAMLPLADLFARYQGRFKAPQGSVEVVALQSIKEVCGYEFTRSQVRYVVASRTLYLQVPSLLRSELRFYHDRILKSMRQELGEQSAPKIIL